jgi:hypothetical protein
VRRINVSDKKVLKIVIMGEVNTGRTTFGNLLVKAFREMGFIAEFPGEEVLSEEDIERRLTGLVGKIEKVIIEEVQLQRGTEQIDIPTALAAATKQVNYQTAKMNQLADKIDQWVKEGKLHRGGVTIDTGIPVPPVSEYPPEIQEQIKKVGDTIREALKENFLGYPRLPNAATGHLEVGAGLRQTPVMGDQVWIIKSWDPDRVVTTAEMHSGTERVFSPEELLDYEILPPEAVAMLSPPVYCPHMRPAGHPCPHCLGINDLPPPEPVTMECPSCHRQVSMLISGQCSECYGKVTR